MITENPYQFERAAKRLAAFSLRDFFKKPSA